jgi:hypothetical protein
VLAYSLNTASTPPIDCSRSLAAVTVCLAKSIITAAEKAAAIMPPILATLLPKPSRSFSALLSPDLSDL